MRRKSDGTEGRDAGREAGPEKRGRGKGARSVGGGETRRRPRVQTAKEEPPLAPEVDREINRLLENLRAVMRERKVTQLEIQARMGWGKSFISQIVTRQKRLQVEQLLSILYAMEVPPARFFARAYQFPETTAGRPRAYAFPTRPDSEIAEPRPWLPEIAGEDNPVFTRALAIELLRRGILDRTDLLSTFSWLKGELETVGEG